MVLSMLEKKWYMLGCEDVHINIKLIKKKLKVKQLN